MQIRYFLVIAVGSIALLYLLSRRRKELPSWLIIVPGLIVIGAMAVVVATQWDDAYITYRYAENLAKGHGPVFNAGERVEGYSNPLWMLLLAGGIAVGVPPTILAPLVAALLLVALFLLLDGILVQEGLRRAWLRGTLPVALGLSPAFVLWWFSGMEAPAYALLIVAIAWCISKVNLTNSKSARRVGLLLAVMVLIRPDAILMAMVGVVYLLSKAGKSHWRHWARSAAWLLGPLAVVIVALTAFRLAYYGEWLPNTFYCKLGGDPLARLRPGLVYISEQVKYLGGTALLVLAVIALLRARVRNFVGVGLVTVGLYTAFFVCSGGDALAHRFFVHITPLIYVLGWIGGAAVGTALEKSGRLSRPATYVTGIVLLIIVMPTVTHISNFGGARALGNKLHSVANLLSRTVPKDFELAITAVGIIPYETGMPTIDMLGLCDTHIARGPPKCGWAGHQKWDGEYVVSRAPDLILPQWANPFDTPDGLSSRRVEEAPNIQALYNEIRAEPRFRRDYDRVSVPFEHGKWLIFWGHNRRDWKSLIPDAVVVSMASDYPEEDRAPQ